MDVNAIAELTKQSQQQMIKRKQDETIPVEWEINLEEVAKAYEEQNSKVKVSIDKWKLWWDKSVATIYIDSWEFFDIRWVEYFEVVDIWKLRRNIKIEIGDKFVWDKHLVKWLWDISNVDKIWETEEIYQADNEYVNDLDANKFKLYFNPLTYQKCQWNINSEN